jgi:crotonobetainyl-CoA:carnitine CoA-transferase CaiB-like acyl-CoA transferase
MSPEVNSQSPVFEGLNVVELSQGMSGPLACQLLADNGASVVKIEPPTGDWAREMPGFRMWNRGKQSVVLDLSTPKGKEQALALIDEADVLVECVRGGTQRALGLSAAELRARNPSLVHCTITGFGLAKKWEKLPSYEGVVAARIGRWMGADRLSGMSEINRGPRPVFNITPFGSYGCACLVLVGIVGALRHAKKTGEGSHIDTSLLDGIAAATMRVPFRRDGAKVDPVGATKDRSVLFRGINLAFLTPECSDGRFIQMCARQPDHYKRWMKAIGLGHMLEEPRFANGPVGFLTIADVDEVEVHIRAAMAKRTQAEWMDLFAGEFDVGADPFLTPPEFLAMADMVDNGRVVEFEDPAVGRTTQVGPLALIEGVETTIGRPAPALGEHQALLDRLPAANAARESGAGAATGAAPAQRARPPLEGITVLEAAYFIAGPMGASVLAELGARVIKLEPLEGDPFRATLTEFAQMAHGKESIAVDLKHPQAKELVERLIAKSDILLHSFRPGAPVRLGLDYETAHALNPGIVYLYAGSYGSKGPQARRPAFHSTPNALCGAGLIQGGEGNPPVDDSYPDPCSALGVAAALAIGLHARERTGVGQAIETTMLASTGYVHSDMVVQYPGRPAPMVPDQGQHGFHALYRLYPCASGWIFVAAIQDKEWHALAKAVGHPEWIDDAAYATRDLRFTDAGLTEKLAEILLTDDADNWQDSLLAAGVPATRADENSFEEFLVDNVPHFPMTHPVFGDYWRRGPVIRLDTCESAPIRGAPSLGEHTEALLAELGYSEEERAALINAGAVKASQGGKP